MIIRNLRTRSEQRVADLDEARRTLSPRMGDPIRFDRKAMTDPPQYYVMSGKHFTDYDIIEE